MTDQTLNVQPDSRLQRPHADLRDDEISNMDNILLILLILFIVSAIVALNLGIAAAVDYSQKHNYVSHNTYVSNHTITPVNCRGEVCYTGGIITAQCQGHSFQVIRAETRSAVEDYLSTYYPIGYVLPVWIDGDSCTLDPDIEYPTLVIILIVFSCVSLITGIAWVVTCCHIYGRRAS